MDFHQTALSSLNSLCTPEVADSGELQPILDQAFDVISDILYYDLKKEQWARRPRTYALLSMIHAVKEMDAFISLGHTDISLPYETKTSLPRDLQSPEMFSKFCQFQHYVLSTAYDLEKGGHCTVKDGNSFFKSNIEKIGKGGSGTVEKVQSKLTGIIYARKRMRRIKKGNGREVFKRFEKELHTLRKLSHDHLVAVKGSYTDLNYVALLITPVADCNLKKYLQQPLPECDKSVFRTYYGCLTNAVRYLKDSQIRHNDIKPENILLHNQHIYIADFGTALDWSGTEFSNSVTKGNITSVTPRYQSPEVNSGAPRRSSNDIWSLGVVFLEMTTVLRGKTLKNLEDHFHRNGTANPFVFHNLDAAISWFRVLQPMPGLSDNTPLQWIKEMISKDPINRRTAVDLFEDIGEADGGIWCGRCCKETESESESMSDTDEDMDNTIRPDLPMPVQNKEVMEPSHLSPLLQPARKADEYTLQDSKIVIEAEEVEKNISQASKPNFEYAVPSPYTYVNYPQQASIEYDTQLLPGAFPETPDEELPLIITVEPCTYNPAPVLEKDKDITFESEPSILPQNVITAPVKDSIEIVSIVEENRDIPIQPDALNVLQQATTAPVQHTSDLAPVVEDNGDLPTQTNALNIPQKATAAPVQDNEDLAMVVWFPPIVEENKGLPIQCDDSTLSLLPTEAPIQNHIQLTPFAQLIWTNSDDIHTSPSYILKTRIRRRRSYDNLNHISIALLQNMSSVDNDRLRRSTSYESLQDDYENLVPDTFMRIKEELLSFRLSPLWVGKLLKIQRASNPPEPDKGESPKYQPKSIPLEENGIKKWLSNMRAPSSSPQNSPIVLQGPSINKKEPQPTATRMSPEVSLPLTAGNLDDLSHKPKVKEKIKPVNTNIYMKRMGPEVSLPLTAGNLDNLIHKPMAKEKIKPVNASIYMKKIWDDAASSAPTSVMSSRTAKRFSSAGVFLPWQDKTLNFLGQYTKEGSVSAVRLLLKSGCNPGKKGEPRWEPIFNAVRGASDRHVKCVRELINYGVDVNAKNKVSRRTPLQYAIEHEAWSGYSNLIYILLAAGADPNIKDAMGDVPLLQILYGGNEPLPKHRRDALALLLAPNYSTDINVSPPGTMNGPLHLAVRRKDPWAVGMLLEKNAPVDGENGAGLTPLQLAMGSWTATTNHDQLEILRLLLEKKANVNVKNTTDGRTPLHIAISLEIIDAVRMLLQHGAKRSIKDGSAKSARQLYQEQAKAHKNCKKCPEVKTLMEDNSIGNL
ncbi:hypothetical protein VE01_05901 [Pseudogymnoascus verrucosus]|uniref:Protein kinase domain-containing protein n=1 Tax=Pseudogymnoascus verrucosus TaxID=342668 RepID=A0A1B8GI95_9PEZI|nr:uncharacterized protein VE01_05901 [Pseudogymnoascus verrucosus]OBT95560.1 hypothetical protein VE01_05901 [Pseudogymnoascus verrucosus]